MRYDSIKLSLGLLSLFAMALVSSCQISPTSNANADTRDASLATEQASDTKLEKALTSHLWQLTAFFGQNIATTGNTNISFTPQNQRISGSAGCNRYFGSYTLHQNDIRFSQMGATKMMCMDMTEEDAFFKHIHQVTRLQLHDHILTFFDHEMPLMQFTAQALPKTH